MAKEWICIMFTSIVEVVQKYYSKGIIRIFERRTFLCIWIWFWRDLPRCKRGLGTIVCFITVQTIHHQKVDSSKTCLISMLLLNHKATCIWYTKFCSLFILNFKPKQPNNSLIIIDLQKKKKLIFNKISLILILLILIKFNSLVLNEKHLLLKHSTHKSLYRISNRINLIEENLLT